MNPGDWRQAAGATYYLSNHAINTHQYMTSFSKKSIHDQRQQGVGGAEYVAECRTHQGYVIRMNASNRNGMVM
jgi:hypothetical protein